MKKKLAYKLAVYSVMGALSSGSVFASFAPSAAEVSPDEGSLYYALSFNPIFTSSGNETEDAKKVKEAIKFFLKKDADHNATFVWFYENDLQENKKELGEFIKTNKFMRAKPSVKLKLLAQWCASEEKLWWIINNQERLNRQNRGQIS
jgi:hypothetical protein